VHVRAAQTVNSKSCGYAGLSGMSDNGLSDIPDYTAFISD